MKINRIFFLILSFLIIFIIYEKFPKYLDQEKYVKIFVLSVFLSLSILATFIKKKIYKKNKCYLYLFYYYHILIKCVIKHTSLFYFYRI